MNFIKLQESSERLKLLTTKNLEPMATMLTEVNKGYSGFSEEQEIQTITLIRAVILHAGDLERAYQVRRANLISISTRSLLELNIWTRFCNKSKENAERFLTDAARDSQEILDTFHKLHIATVGVPQPRFEELKEELREASKEYYDNLFDGSYKRVHEAAREVGLGDMFSGVYKLCSKLAHPTSLMVNMPEHTDSLVDVIYMLGEAFGTGAIYDIRATMQKQFPNATI